LNHLPTQPRIGNRILAVWHEADAQQKKIAVERQAFMSASTSEQTFIDLRSDTVTRPSPALRRAMADAEVGDDVYGEDPTVLRLEAFGAELLGKEAALFVSSGTMGNQLAIACLTRPGDEVIVGEGAHVAFYESGAGPALSGVQFQTAGSGGFFGVSDLEEAMKPRAYWCPRTSLVCVENTHNRAGGRILDAAHQDALVAAAHRLGLATHLDGARLWNAAVATGLPIERLAAPFDTVTVCFSKGLGAPAGSLFAGTRAIVEEARRFRKRWGGGMRQVGILAAGALHAVKHHRSGLVDDHIHAKRLADALSSAGVVTPPETNIVLVDLPVSADAVAAAAKRHGVLASVFGPKRLRFVTHRDVDTAAIDRAAAIVVHVVAELTLAAGQPGLELS
jgi:threonine aldolase